MRGRQESRLTARGLACALTLELTTCSGSGVLRREAEEETLGKVAALSDAVILSVVTRVELEGGVQREPEKAVLRRPALLAMLDALPVVGFDDQAADAYRQILEVAGYSRRKVLDRMIAAQALVHRATLITRNPNDFRDVPGLDLLAW